MYHHSFRVRIARVLSACVLALSSLATMLADDQSAGEGKSSPKATTTQELRREGTRFDGMGKFAISGDRVNFEPLAGGESFRVVENLSLERVMRVLSAHKEPREWNVTGVFLEYQGGNYLLLTRAALPQPVAKGPKRPSQDTSAPTGVGS